MKNVLGDEIEKTMEEFSLRELKNMREQFGRFPCGLITLEMEKLYKLIKFRIIELEEITKYKKDKKKLFFGQEFFMKEGSD